ncbi:phage tail protein [Pigmentiphaga daeguensis]|uniref:Phage tail protein n=1 Tax=Pigmentiphaga daeguensis TaxID=414049 RepID=A0ABN1BAZ4_9BURK
MGVKLPNGAVVSIATAYGTPVPITALSNANPAVATAAAHGFANGDILELTSAWTKISGRAVRVAASASGNFALEGINTSDTQAYPTGGGVGSARKVSTWVPIAQVLEVSMSGGDQQFWNFGFLEDAGDDKQIPTSRNPMSATFTLADDPDLPHHDALLAADEARTPRIVRIALPGGSALYWNAYVGYSGMPTLTRNQGMACTLSLSLAARPMRYKAAAV